MGPVQRRKFSVMLASVTEMILKALVFVLLLFFRSLLPPGPGRLNVRSTERRQKKIAKRMNKFWTKKAKR